MERSIGVIVGVIVGVLVGLLLWKVLTAKEGSEDTSGIINGKEYDERQELIRGRGYKYAYFISLAGLGFLLIAEIIFPGAVRNFFPVAAMVTLFGSITVFAVYCIRKEAFLGLTQNARQYIILMAVIVFFNVLSLALNMGDFLKAEDIFSDLSVWMNICSIFTFGGVLISLLAARKEGEDEES